MRLALVVAFAAQFLVGADGLAVAIALPAIRDTFGDDPSWVLTAHGHFRARAPRRRFPLRSRSSAQPSPRAASGTRALGLLAGMAGLGTLAGMLPGGAITTAFGWRRVFGLLATPGLATALTAPRAVREARATGARSGLDVAGALLVTVGPLVVLFGLTRIERHGTGARAAVVPLTAGLLLLAAFAAWERRAPAPLLRFELLRVPSLRAATVAVGLNAIGFTAIVFVGTLHLQEGLGYSAWEAGPAALPVDAVAFAISLAARDYVAQHSPRVLLPPTSPAAPLRWPGLRGLPSRRPTRST